MLIAIYVLGSLPKLSAAAASTSNLLKHLTKQLRRTLLSDPCSSTDTTSATPIKQAKLSFTSPVQKVSESELKKMIAGYTVEEMLPLRTVESPYFRRIKYLCVAKKQPYLIEKRLPRT